MKTLFALLFLTLLVGCTSTQEAPPQTPSEDLHALVLQTDKEWAVFIEQNKVSGSDAAAVSQTRQAYTTAQQSADKERVRKAAQNYIGLVTELMMPTLKGRKA